MYEIHCHSDILGKLVPSAHGTFDAWHKANQYAESAIRYGTKFEIVAVK